MKDGTHVNFSVIGDFSHLIFYYNYVRKITAMMGSTARIFWTQKNIFHLFTKQTKKQTKHKLFVLNWLIRTQSTSCSERRYRANLKWLFGLKNENRIWRENSRPTANKCRYPEWEKISTKRSETKNWIFTMTII